MLNFDTQLSALRADLWFEDCDSVPGIERKLANLSRARLPVGIVRLPTAGFFVGPHLEPQSDDTAFDTSLALFARA